MRHALIGLSCAIALVAGITAQTEEASAGASDMLETKVLMEFGEEDKPWRNIDDAVMGGVSRSTFSVEKGKAVFEGKVSLDNNGGFASVRSLPTLHDLTGYDGLLLRVRTNGRDYGFRLRMSSAFDGVSYQARVEDQGDGWSVVRLPFSSFTPTFRGRPVPGAPTLDPGKIMTFGFIIAEKQTGSFKLEIDWISAYKTEAPKGS